MTTDTPTPYQPPDGVILTTLGEVRRIGRGQVMETTFADLDVCEWRRIDSLRSWTGEVLVWWRPTPKRTVTIELPEWVARDIVEVRVNKSTGGLIRDACRDAIARLDGES